MNIQQRSRSGSPGYISYVLVISTSLILTLITFFAFKRAVDSKEVQAGVQLKIDYTEKEDAILRSIVAITPNRAMGTMMVRKDASSGERNALRWLNIFNEALDMANARSSISPQMQAKLASETTIIANVGDSEINRHNDVFHPISGNNRFRTNYCSAGINRSLGAGFPPPPSNIKS